MPCSKGDTIKLHMSSDTKLLTLDVKDTGVGMSPSVLDNVFEPFFSNSEKGTGLGMMIVQSIVEGTPRNIGVEIKRREWHTGNDTHSCKNVMVLSLACEQTLKIICSNAA